MNLNLGSVKSNTAKVDHFGDILSSQSLGIILKKLNLTQKAHTHTHTHTHTHKL